MKYLPTIDLWNAGVEAAIRAGQLQLQTGQWVRCGNGPKSRYIGTSKHTINVAHYPQTSGARFRTRVLGYRCSAGIATESQRSELIASFNRG